MRLHLIVLTALTICLSCAGLSAQAQKSETSPTLEFSKSGKKEPATNLIYRIDFLTALTGEARAKLVQLGRKEGLEGTDQQIINGILNSPSAMQQAFAFIEGLSPTSENKRMQANLQAALTFQGLAFPGYSIRIGTDHLRAESLGASYLGQAVRNEMVGLGYFKQRKSLGVGFFLNLPVSIKDDGFKIDSLFGLQDYLKQTQEKNPPTVTIVRNANWDGYASTVVRLEFKTPIDESTSQPTVFTIHALLVGGETPYDPKKRVFIDLYYTPALYAVVPPDIRAFKSNFNIDGLFYGFKMYTEKNIGYGYKVSEIIQNASIFAGEMVVPPGFPEMTAEQAAQAALSLMMGRPAR